MAINAEAARIGEAGELFVAKQLTLKGYQILDRNWRIRGGEIDLVAKAPDEVIVFIEVKTRSSASYGDPLEAITPQKSLRIQKLALAWLATHQRLGNPYRIDVAGVLVTRAGRFTLDYREGIL